MADYFNQGSKKQQETQRIIKILLAFIGVVVVVYALSETNPTKPFTDTLLLAKSEANTLPSSTHKGIDPLDNAIQDALDGTKGRYGVVVHNLKTGEVYSLNENQVYQPGSLYKLWVMAATYKQIQEGSLTEDEVLSEDVATLNDKFSIDPDSADLTEGTITLTVRDALNQMITISHNYAALLLTERIKLSNISKFLKDANLNQSTVGTNGEMPTTTASDVALFFEKLYKGQLASPTYTQEMIELLKNQQLNGKIPKYIPKGVEIAHKTGEIDLFSHDAGIVYTPKGDYIIVALSESDAPSLADDRISLISKAIYGYETR